MNKTRPDQKYSVFNHRDQPVEVHLAYRVLVLAPGESAEVTEEEARSEHLRALQQRALVTVLVSEVEQPAPEKPRAARTAKATSPPRRKTEKN